MRAGDFTDGCTWVLGVTSAGDTVLYLRRCTRDGMGLWVWASNPLRAETFKTRELAQECLDSDKTLADMVRGTMPETEVHRLKPVKIELRAVVVEE